MPKTIAKKPAAVVRLTAPWQIAFIVAVISSQLAWAFIIAWSYTRHGQYVSSGTWTYQIVQWLYPILYLLAGFLFVQRRVVGTVPQLFWAVFLACTGMMLYGVSAALMNFLRANWLGYGASADRGLLGAFGWDWLQMAVVFVLFCLTLAATRRRGKRP